MTTYNSQTFSVLLEDGFPTWTPGEPAYAEFPIPNGTTVIVQKGPAGLDRLVASCKCATITVANALIASRGLTLRTLADWPVGNLTLVSYTNVALFHARMVRWPSPLDATVFLELEFTRQPS